MAQESAKPIRIELDLPNDDQRLLAGLEAWLQLGLISHEQVRSLCAHRLCCRFTPPPANDSLALLESSTETEPVTEPIGDFVFVESTPAAASTQSSKEPSRVEHWLGKLMGELSVIWLLGLGVFLVVLSSAVLAATQWGQFNPVGQYLVLFTYTLIFWGAGLWSAPKDTLQLTSKTLQIITLLLVPLNFWAIDGLGIWRGGWLVGLGASALLGAIAYRLMGRWSATPTQRWIFLGFGLLQLGWSNSWIPVVAVYAGALVSGALLLRELAANVARWPLLLINFGFSLLLLRGLATLDSNNWGQLGVAFGIYGATWIWRGQYPDQADDETTRLPRLWSRRLGQALLWWGWIIAIDSWPAQALGVSALGLGLRLERQRQSPQRRNLFLAFAIALQIPFLGWRLLPAAIQQGLVSPLANGLETTSNPTWLLGITLYPYVVGLVAIADFYRRQDTLKMSRFSERLAVGFNILLSAISTFAPAVLVVNLIASTITGFVVTLRWLSTFWQVFLSHGLALATIFVTVNHRLPNLSSDGWMLVVFGLMALNLLLSRWLPAEWNRSSWLFGLGLAGLAYVLLWNHLLDNQFQSSYSLLGLTIPLLLTGLRRSRWSLLTLGLTAPLTLSWSTTRLIGLGSATGLSAANGYLRKRLSMSVVAVGFGLGFTISLIGDGIAGFPSRYTQWYGVLALLTATLWILDWGLLRSNLEGAILYGRACKYWGFALAVGLLLVLTAEVGLLYANWRSPDTTYTAALGILIGALLLRTWRRPQAITVYLLSWSVELFGAEIVALQGGTRLTLAALTIGFGVAMLVVAAVFQQRQPELLPHLRILTLLYGLVGLALRIAFFNAWTGWSVLAVALLSLEISRQTHWRWLRWLSLAGITLGWYELVLYQLSLSEGDHPADGLVILAVVAAVIMVIYRLSATWLEARLNLPKTELIAAAHIHWGIASLLMVISGGLVYSSGSGLLVLALIIGLGLVAYGLLQGRNAAASSADFWIYGGLIELVGCCVYLRLALPELAVVDNWWGGVACGFAAIFYWIPWQRYGWPLSPWRRFAIALPPIIILLTSAANHVPTLWILAGFYAFLAWTTRQLRLSYLSAGCLVWAIWVGLEQQGIRDVLAYVLPLGLSGLYVAQFDPELQISKNRKYRHWLRVLSLGIILFVALLMDRWTGLPVGVGSLVFIALGLWQRVRAYLYISTVIFGLNAINQLIWLNAEYPLIKWIIGIGVGIGLIWIAADFERRRAQWVDLTQTWLDQLHTWD